MMGLELATPQCTSQVRSQPQLRNDKYIMDKLNSFPVIAFELVTSMARPLGL